MGVLEIGSAVALVGLCFAGWRWLDAKFERKADKHDVHNKLQELKTELHLQRGHVSKIFDQQREDGQLAEVRHRELMMHLLKDGG
jgi:hypothetical protein